MKKRRATALILSALILSSAFCGCQYTLPPIDDANTAEETTAESQMNLQQEETTTENETNRQQEESENFDNVDNLTADTEYVSDYTLFRNQDYFGKIYSNQELKEQLRKFYRYEDSYIKCNFLNKEIGYVFICIPDGFFTELSTFLKTTDGGNTWISQEVQEVPSIYWKDRIIYAKMINENIGFILGENAVTAGRVSERTYITTDGGKTWKQVIFDDDIIDTKTVEAYDVIYADGEYILCFRDPYSKDVIPSYRYASTDLKTWVPLDGGWEPANHYPSSEYTEYHVFYKYSSQTNKILLQIKDWEEIKTFELDFEVEEISCCVADVTDEKGWLILWHHGIGHIYTFQKGDTTLTELSTLNIDGDLMTCSFVSPNIGFVFCTQEDVVEPNNLTRVLNLYRTDDGGVTWTSVAEKAAPATGWKEAASFACFLDEKIGIIGYGNYASVSVKDNTYLTQDGGKTWELMETIPICQQASPAHGDYYCAVADFVKAEDFYILTVYDSWHGILQYRSTDLVTWEEIVK